MEHPVYVMRLLKHLSSPTVWLLPQKKGLLVAANMKSQNQHKCPLISSLCSACRDQKCGFSRALCIGLLMFSFRASLGISLITSQRG